MFCMNIFGQVGIGTSNPHQSSKLDISSSTRGFLPPRMSIAQRDNIANPATGLVIYNTSTHCLEWNNGDPNAPDWFKPCADPQVVVVSQCSVQETGSLFTNTFPGGVTQMILVDIQGAGIKTITTDTVNGVYFSYIGEVQNGTQNLILRALGTPQQVGTFTYTITFGGNSCTFDRTVAVPQASMNLNCAGIQYLGGDIENNRVLTNSDGFIIRIPYTQGNGGTIGALAVNSTTITGYTASTAAGNVSVGNGNLDLTITGGSTNSTGVAQFNIQVDGQTCQAQKNIIQPLASVTSLNCAGASLSSALQPNQVIANGTTLSVPYSGGNGASYPSRSFVVNGITAQLPAGSLANGSGTLVFNLSGNTGSAGTHNLNINLFHQNCTVAIVVQDIFANVRLVIDQESFFSGGIGLYSSFRQYVYGLPSVADYGSDYIVKVNGVNKMRSTVNSTITNCAVNPGDACLRSGWFSIGLPNGKELKVYATRPPTAPSTGTGSNRTRRRICKDEGPDDPAAANDYTCTNHNVN
jgi:hypothetical protein